MLSPYRVLDLTDERGQLCGKILADLGADVIKIEPPGGDSARNFGPFARSAPHPEESLFWLAFNNNKRGITLNLETRDGAAIFKEMVKKAHFLVESFRPGYMNGLGLGYSELRKTNPGLVYTSITPFGSEGPYSHYKAPDLVSIAMGGLLFLTGDSDRPPVRISFPQTYFHASAHAALGSMIAHHHRQLSGTGQHVDVSAQQAWVWTLMQGRSYWDMNHIITYRQGSQWYRGGSRTTVSQTWQCKDGYVTYVFFSGKGPNISNKALAKWIDEEGMSNDFLRNFDWDSADMNTISQDAVNGIEDRWKNFFLAHTKQDLYEGAIKRRVWLFPLNNVKDIYDNAQLKFRNYWIDVEHPELKQSLKYPGIFYRSSLATGKISRRAPRLGEHNLEFFEGDMGYSRQQILILKQAGVI